MKKSFKRLFAAVLTVIMIMTAIPFAGIDFDSAFAAKASAKDLSSYSVGDTITFGSYPQSRVTNSSTVSALNSISKTWISYGYYSGTGDWSDGKMKPSDYMKYCDISYNGNKYRAVTFSAYRPYYTGYESSISETHQADNGYYTGKVYYFKYEPLVWRVLDPDEGFVMCNSVIDAQAYNSYFLYYDNGNDTDFDDYYGDSAKSYYASDWENSSLRAWLNNDFYNTSFSSAEKAEIGTTYNKTEGVDCYSPEYSSAGTADQIFLLSYDEALNTEYGFVSDYLECDTAKQLKPTDYAQCQECYTYPDSSSEYFGNTWWWLRSPCWSYNAASINCNGVTEDCVENVNAINGICPALKFNPDNDIDLSNCNVGDTFEFGSYPQSRLTDSTIISALNSQRKVWKSYGYYSGTGEWDGTMAPSDYMKYCDISYNGNKYRAVTISEQRPGYTPDELGTYYSWDYQAHNGYSKGNTYYFKFEPLTWRVLDPSEGFVMCNEVIDSQAFNNFILEADDKCWGNSSQTYYASDWANSSLRAWLNNDFYNTAFTSLEKSMIGITDNKTESTYSSEYDSANTSDKIFILSYDDAINADYGFDPVYDNDDTARQLEPTDYAKCQGCYSFADSSSEFFGKTWWWIRSPYDSCCVAEANLTGTAYILYYNYVINTTEGICPAFKFYPKNSCDEHDYESYVSEKPTCETDGEVTFVCSVCGDSYTKKIAALGHDFSEWIVTEEPTSAKEGEETRYCSRCDETETRTIPASGSSAISVKLQENIELKYKSTAKLVSLIHNPDDIKCITTYESSDSGIAMVDNNGNIIATGRGTTTITCTVTDINGNVVKDTCDVNVYFTFGQWLIWILLLGFLWY